MQLNASNFIRWYTGVVADTTVNLPRLGLNDAKQYLPAYLPGEQAGFFINSDIPFYDTDAVANLQLIIVDQNGNTVVTIGTVMQKAALSLGYRLYAAFSFPQLPVGFYQYAIVNTATNTVKCTSNLFQVVPDATTTVLLRYNNTRDFYYYNWQLAGSNFYCAIRLHLSLAAIDGEGSIEQTKAVTTGLRRNNNNDIDKAVKLTTYYFDDGANDGALATFQFDFLELNDRRYLQKSLYKGNIRIVSAVSLGEIELYDQSFSAINKYGQLPHVVVKTGKAVLLNSTSANITANQMSATGVLIATYTCPPGSALKIDINQLQINSTLNITSATNTITQAHTLPDGSFIYSQTAGSSITLTQNAIYGNDYILLFA